MSIKKQNLNLPRYIYTATTFQDQKCFSSFIYFDVRRAITTVNGCLSTPWSLLLNFQDVRI